MKYPGSDNCIPTRCTDALGTSKTVEDAECAAFLLEFLGLIVSHPTLDGTDDFCIEWWVLCTLEADKDLGQMISQYQDHLKPLQGAKS